MTMKIRRIAERQKTFTRDEQGRPKHVITRVEPERMSVRDRLIAHVHKHPDDLVAFKALFPGIEVQAVFK